MGAVSLYASSTPIDADQSDQISSKNIPSQPNTPTKKQSYGHLMKPISLLSVGLYGVNKELNQPETSTPMMDFSEKKLSPLPPIENPLPVEQPVTFYTKCTVDNLQISTISKYNSFFNDLPVHVRNNPLVQQLNNLYEQEFKKTGKPPFQLDSPLPLITPVFDTSKKKYTVREFLDIIKKELCNPAENELFHKLVQNFKNHEEHLNLDAIETYTPESFRDPNLFFPLKNPNTSDLYYCYSNKRPLYSIDNRMYNLYLMCKIEHYWHGPWLTFFENPDEGIPKRSSAQKLFQIILYNLIKNIPNKAETIDIMRNKKIVMHFERCCLKYLDEEKPNVGVLASSEWSCTRRIFSGKNYAGKMLTYAIQQMLLPENLELLNHVILGPDLKSWKEAQKRLMTGLRTETKGGKISKRSRISFDVAEYIIAPFLFGPTRIYKPTNHTIPQIPPVVIHE